MYYFRDNTSLRVVSRPTEVNPEVLDGKLTLIEPNSECYLLSHTPNKNNSYDVVRLEILDAEDGIKKLNPLPQKIDVPSVFFTVILKHDFNTYVRDYMFTEIKGKLKTKEKDPIVKTNIEAKKINSFDNSRTISTGTSTFDYTPKLTRTSEKASYKFTPGSKKYK